MDKNEDLNQFEQEQLLAEYNTLRSEILISCTEANNLFLLAFTVVGVAWGLALTNDIPYLFLLAILLLIPIRSRYYWWEEGTTRLAAYIVVYIESHAKYLNWETRIKHARVLRSRQTKTPFGVLGFGQNYCFSLLSLSTIVVWLYYSSFFKILNNSSAVMNFVKTNLVMLLLSVLGFSYIFYLELFARKIKLDEKEKPMREWINLT